jgi:GTPase SAR1 family protein
MSENQESLAEIETLLQCSDHIEFVREVLARSTITTSVKTEIETQINRIQHRQRDTNLYLAVVGEFSSGKSTFINALLRDELLKTSALVTTAAATRICHNTNLRIRVKFSGNHPEITTRVGQEKVDIPWLSDFQSTNIINFIHAVTADPAITQDVVDLTIEHPSSFLANGVTIIDTPGTNDDLEYLTRKVVEEEADLAIIIIPGTIPLSETLADFIKNSLHPYLHRCIFVVSRMDQIRAKEQHKTLESLQKRLTNKLGITAPILYPCSAQVSLDFTNGVEVESKELAWKQKFTELETIIVERLNRGRTICIAESLLRLLNQLFQRLDSQLQIQCQEYEAKKAKIQASTIPNLSQFTDEQYSFCENKLKELIKQYLEQMENCVLSHREQVKNKVHDQLFSILAEDGLNRLLQFEVENILTENQQNLRIDLDKIGADLTHEATIIGKVFDQRFSEVYRNLESLGGAIEIATVDNYDLRSQTSKVAISAQTITRKIDSDDGRKMGMGAVAGFVIGTVILPGVGTAIGIAAGSWASRFFTPPLSERKQKLWEELQANIKVYFDALQAEIYKSSVKHSNELEKSLKVKIDRYIEKYELIVENIFQAQAKESQGIEQMQGLIARDSLEIHNRKNRLSGQRCKLATIDI